MLHPIAELSHRPGEIWDTHKPLGIAALCGRCCHTNIEATVRVQAGTTASRERGVMTSMTHLGPRGHD